MRSLCDQKKMTIAERSQRSRKGFTEVVKRSPIGRRTKLVASCLLSMHKRLTATNLVIQRFHWSARGLKKVSCWSQIGLRRCGDRFHHEKGGDLRNVAATYLWLISDEAMIDRRFIADQLQSDLQACANHSAIGYKRHRPVCAWQRHFATSARRVQIDFSKCYAKVPGKKTFLLSKVSTSTVFAFSLSIVCTPSWQQLHHFDLLFHALQLQLSSC